MRKLKLDELGRISVDEFKNADKVSLTLVLDNVRSLHNVGSIFRTADAFRIEKIFLTGITGTPPHREIQKTALGATESVAWEYVANTIDAVTQLKQSGYTIVSVEQTTESKSLFDVEIDRRKKYCLIFGNEVDGVQDDVVHASDMALEIPQHGTKHSLNVAVCAGIVIWEFFKKGFGG